MWGITSERQNHRKTVFSDLCLFEYHSFEKHHRWKSQLSFASAHLWSSRCLILICIELDHSKANKIGLPSSQSSGAVRQCSKWVWDASVAASVAGRLISAEPQKMDSSSDYWTGKWMYSLHQPQTGNFPPQMQPQYSWCTLHPRDPQSHVVPHLWRPVWNILLFGCHEVVLLEAVVLLCFLPVLLVYLSVSQQDYGKTTVPIFRKFGGRV